MRALALGFAVCGVAACAAPGEPEAATAPGPAAAAWSFADHANALRAASCADASAFERPQALAITAAPVDRGTDGDLASAVQGMRLAGAWSLAADDPNFGGLSGLAVQPSGSLLAISDAGAWVSIGIDTQTGAPDGLGAIGYMRGADGKLLSGKDEADAEGLALKDGLALVSFEQDHRIEAFDLEGCGMGARSAFVARLPGRILGNAITGNTGAEALALDASGALRAGFELWTAQGSPEGRVVFDGAMDDIEALFQPQGYLLTGMDMSGDRRAHVFRAYDPVRGARVIVQVTREGAATARADLKPPLPVDNFEAVAFGATPDGGTRLWLLADDNFSDRQRTLLLAFDLDR